MYNFIGMSFCCGVDLTRKTGKLYHQAVTYLH